MTHIRDEADKRFAALDEVIAIGERAHSPVEHSHIKLGHRERLEQGARVCPHDRSGACARPGFPGGLLSLRRLVLHIKVLVPNKQYEDPVSVEGALADSAARAA